MVEFREIRTNGIGLHVAEAGRGDGALVFLLHGFPEFWYGWRNQIEALAERGFHVVAPDLRGYNLSDKPKGVASYRAVLKKPLLPAAEYRIACPTLVIWGKRDIYATPELAEASIRLCEDGRMVYLDQATHWVQHDEPEQVVELIASFIARGDATCGDRQR